MVGIYRRGDKHVAVTARQPPLEPGETLPTKRYQQIRRVAQPAVRYNDDRVRDIRLTSVFSSLRQEAWERRKRCRRQSGNLSRNLVG